MGPPLAGTLKRGLKAEQYFYILFVIHLDQEYLDLVDNLCMDEEYFDTFDNLYMDEEYFDTLHKHLENSRLVKYLKDVGSMIEVQ